MKIRKIKNFFIFILGFILITIVNSQNEEFNNKSKQNKIEGIHNNRNY